MTVVIDASVVLLWFVDRPGSENAIAWYHRLTDDPGALVAPDVLRFEVFGGLARLQPRRSEGWARRSFDRFDRIEIPLLPSTRAHFDRALRLSEELRIGGYDALYIAHAESLAVPWLTADEKALRRLSGDHRVRRLGAGPT